VPAVPAPAPEKAQSVLETQGKLVTGIMPPEKNSRLIQSDGPASTNA